MITKSFYLIAASEIKKWHLLLAWRCAWHGAARGMALRMAWRCAGSAASGAPSARTPPRTGSRPGVSEQARKKDEMNFPDFCFPSEFFRTC
jgi:hypothetical protein